MQYIPAPFWDSPMELPTIVQFSMTSKESSAEIPPSPFVIVNPSMVVAADIVGEDRPMHKYAIQITVADERDDGWVVSRGAPRDAAIRTEGDHRIAMSFAIAALTGDQEPVPARVAN